MEKWYNSLIIYLHIYYLLTYLIIYSMAQILSWEANRFSANKEILRTLYNATVHYRIHKCPLPVSIMSKLDPVHTPMSQFLRI
jgi:creatinine amidohydrolase/Fe(II)-dependent formamide hydrolase-like protein